MLKNYLPFACLIMSPFLMGINCRESGSVSISEPSRDRYCDENVSVQATVQNNGGTALILLYGGSKVTVLGSTGMTSSPMSVSATIPWATLAPMRNANAYIVVDLTNLSTPPALGSVLSVDDYQRLVPTQMLIARSTRGIDVCDVSSRL